MLPAGAQSFIEKGIELELLGPQLADFDLDRLGAALLPEHDHLFTYLGLQTLYDRCFIHWDDVRIELPQIFFMRVAMVWLPRKTTATPEPSSFTTC